ncbi:MAG: molybdopterin-binding protein, partial [Desulfatirhabdiaceae bacterium]
MKTVPVKDAIGKILAHDITRIVPGVEKGPAFKKGHCIGAQDIQILLDIGKENIYVLDIKPGSIHENEAAERIARAAAGPGLRMTEPSEGRINLVATIPGLLKINVDALNRLNAIQDVSFATIHSNHAVQVGVPVGGTRVIPLMVQDDLVCAAEELCQACYPLIQVKPFQALRVGVVTTGSEVYHGRIQDKFGPVVTEKFNRLGSTITRQILVSDNIDMTVAAIDDLIREGAQMVVLTGGMSVDPDDQTPASIRATGADVVAYGAPVFPGAMFMLAWLGDIPILGLPGCVMYYQTSIFDLIVPRILAGDRVTREDITR